jgi:Spy/CpxP family protein refolding chaperone
MDIFTQRKLLIRTVILLSILNLVLFGIVLWKDFLYKPLPQDNKENFRDVTDILKNELNLTDDQVDQMKKLRSVFFEKENEIALIIKSERDSINAAMFNNTTNDELVISLARRVAENDYRMELLRLEQSKEFKSICTPKQLEKFEDLVIEIRDYFRHDNQPKKKR